MDFMLNHPMTPKKVNSMLVVVGRFLKNDPFFGLEKRLQMQLCGSLVLREVVRLHGLPNQLLLTRMLNF